MLQARSVRLSKICYDMNYSNFYYTTVTKIQAISTLQQNFIMLILTVYDLILHDFFMAH